jgi:hypothetical protein
MSVVDRGTPPMRTEAVSDHHSAADALAILLAAQPGTLAKLLADHQNDGRGHCRVRRLGQKGHQIWPCNIAAAVQRAAQMRDAEAPR